MFATLAQLDDALENLKPPADTGVNGYVLMIALLMICAGMMFVWRVNKMFMDALKEFTTTIKLQSETHKTEADEHDKRLDEIKAHQGNAEILIAGVGTKIGSHDQWAQIAVTDLKSSVNDGFEKVMARLAEMSEAADKQYAATLKQLGDNHTEFKNSLLQVAVDIASRVSTMAKPEPTIVAAPQPDPAIAASETPEPSPAQESADAPQ